LKNTTKYHLKVFFCFKKKKSRAVVAWKMGMGWMKRNRMEILESSTKNLEPIHYLGCGDSFTAA
jgi:hypothetical protein